MANKGYTGKLETGFEKLQPQDLIQFCERKIRNPSCKICHIEKFEITLFGVQPKFIDKIKDFERGFKK